VIAWARLARPSFEPSVARVRHQDHVAGAGDRLGEIGKTFLRAERDDRLVLRVEVDTEAPRVIGRVRLAQARNAARHRVAVRARVLNGFGQLCDNMRGRGQVGIAHSQIDDVVAHGACLGLLRVHFGEHVGRQTLDAIELVVHGADRPSGIGPPRAGWAYLQWAQTPRIRKTGCPKYLSEQSNFRKSAMSGRRLTARPSPAEIPS
jgi:hypothetical protein